MPVRSKLDVKTVPTLNVLLSKYQDVLRARGADVIMWSHPCLLAWRYPFMALPSIVILEQSTATLGV